MVPVIPLFSTQH